ncbi:flagellar protein FlgN [Ralstonia flaminis]|uniref:flagellar protein FlgN n=1 Tax=Ralstonia flaminis TaxID=3058597 RepID=UPI00292E17B1|nr:flagellar protein FlgN [Ralstonia sp. LMG 18101]
MADIVADGVGYRKLAQLLDDQFAAALRLDAALLGQLAKTIAAEADSIDARRRHRVELLGNAPGAVQAFGERALAGERHTAQRKSFIARCNELNALTARCKALGARNGALLAAQYEAMQRLMHGERHVYVPA